MSSDQTSSGQTNSGQTNSGQTNSGQTNSEQAASEQAPTVAQESMWAAQSPGVLPIVEAQSQRGTSSSSIVALVLSIASWAVCPIIFAIVALVFANKADKEIAASSGQLGGESFSTAAKILSWINIGIFAALALLGILGLLFLTIAGVSAN